jgi:hypothetical protein
MPRSASIGKRPLTISDCLACKKKKQQMSYIVPNISTSLSSQTKKHSRFLILLKQSKHRKRPVRLAEKSWLKVLFADLL